ncbi:multicopper oxidase [Pleomassaria siparia CBS 279.74]|uniref:Multicopper oxidase n=1 Tax=Pleomassaria siparia CBS 279.74 TaxID=1314801 RepID=A0A6G1K9K0_9PLEO|nr:multicopper oxidase [Pleomassaria siparia CBS 279.74]
MGEGNDSGRLLEIEELDWDDETKSTQYHTPRRSFSWLRILIVALLVAWTAGFIIHSLLVPHDKNTNTEPVTTNTPIPAQLRPERDYILDPTWDVEAPPTIREYTWTIAEHTLNPDGVYRPMILINSMFPGPLIECNEGDELVVHVKNRGSNATSIHWHGLYQNGTNWMDGTVGITQCPIAPNHDFTYRFKVNGQSGSYWYHSHMSVQASDGLIGPLIIHSRDDKKLQKVPYSQDRVVLVSDHYYDLSSLLLMQYLSPGSENSEPVPPSAVINGRNMRDCSALPNRNCLSEDRTNAMFDLAPNSNTRLRIINVGAFAEFQLQIDEHEVLITEVDGTDVWPQSIHRVNINPAQRYSIIVVPPTENKGLYWMRARMVTHCFAYENPELKEEVRGVLRYWTSGNTTMPESLDWPEVIGVECRDLNTSDLRPVEVVRAPAKADELVYLRSSFQIGDWTLSRGFLNDTSYRASASSPSLNRLIDGYVAKNTTVLNSLAQPSGINLAFAPSHELVYQTPTHNVLDILIQNFDDGSHPFHLHGYKFFVLASGQGYPSPSLHSSLHLENPLRRDTVSVDAFGWMLIRFVADNSGFWSFHCHISWHSEAGLLMQFLVGHEVVSRWTVPEDVKGLCGREGIEKGMGPNDDMWVGYFGD